MTIREDLEARIANFAALACESPRYADLAECGRRILDKMTPEEQSREIEEEKE